MKPGMLLVIVAAVLALATLARVSAGRPASVSLAVGDGERQVRLEFEATLGRL